MDRSNAELLLVVADMAQRFSAAVVGVVAWQPSTHSAVMAIGPGEPRGRDLEKFRERAATVEAEFRSALSHGEGSRVAPANDRWAVLPAYRR